MAAEYPIPPSLVQAFWNAMVAYADWRSAGGPEPKVSLASQSYSIGSIADFATGHNDAMPERIYLQLCAVATPIRLRYLQSAEDKTFAAGGRCLRAMYDDLLKRRGEA